MNILRETDDERVGLATQDNLFALFRSMASLPGGELVASHGLSFHHAMPSNPMFKGVWGTHLVDEDVEAAIDDVLEWFEAREAPFFFWWTGPGTMPADLGQRLEARGFLSMAEQAEALAPGILATDRGSPCMITELDRLVVDAIDQAPDGLRIDPVTTEEDLAAFVSILVEAMTIPEPLADGWAQASRAVGIGNTPWRMYLGRIGDEPVATNMLFNGGGVASVYGVAVRPGVRGRGLGGAITLAPLLDAREEGYTYAVLFSSLMGVGAYERIGFRSTGQWIDRYLWRRS